MTVTKFERVLKKIHPIYHNYVVSMLADSNFLDMEMLFNHIKNKQSYEYDRRPEMVGVILWLEYLRYHHDEVTFSLL